MAVPFMVVMVVVLGVLGVHMLNVGSVLTRGHGPVKSNRYRRRT